jgi:transcriptional regulator with XRE-family HTH domain
MLYFCNQFRIAREIAGLSQEALAEQLDLSLSTVHRIESGKSMPSIEIIFRFMEATNTPISALIPDRFVTQAPTSLDFAFNKLSTKNKQVVTDTTTTLISALLLSQ